MANAVSPSSPTRQHRTTVQDQSETITFLKATGLGLSVETVSTHISVIVLEGDRALKLKRAVRFPYLDFSTAERRLAACEAELRFNRRTEEGQEAAGPGRPGAATSVPRAASRCSGRRST